ncbi:uncharacterized protein LOC116348348 isoform X2 [Contarinia nasturtii]|uniref:uncharacterized protein LOC116348348 isoform X2 n=1 Tax=Contarinia nasturtii TaxID=265458 RepID=UPI0012D387A5|nr:uncharacterized protein LOC116348348 isoform X2 [Contarinia nasturtii]
MNSNWNDNLEQVLLTHEVGIECEINKTVAAFELLDAPRSPTFVSCFFDILNSRMNESLRKIQMEYLMSMPAHNNDIRRDLKSNNSVVISTSKCSTPPPTSLRNDTTTDDDIAAINTIEVDANEIKPSIETAQTMEENIEAAIMEILNDVDDTTSRAPEIQTDKSQQEEDKIEKAPDETAFDEAENSEATEVASIQIDEPKLETGGHDQIDNIQNDQAQYEEVKTEESQINEATTVNTTKNSEEQINDIDLDSIPLPSSTPPPLLIMSPKSSPIAPMTTPSEMTQSIPPVNTELDGGIKDSMNDQSVLGEADTISNDSLKDDQSTSDDLLGFDGPILLPVGMKSLKRKNVDTLEPNEEIVKKRKISVDIAADTHVISHEEDIVDEPMQIVKAESVPTVAQEPIDGQQMEVFQNQRPQHMECAYNHNTVPYHVVGYTIPNIPKNMDPNVHCKNGPFTCVLCDKTNIMPMHYSMNHDNVDVFVSRPSPKMAQRVMRKAEMSTQKVDGSINAFCFFCEKSFVMTNIEWKDHILFHTGELGYHCQNCRIQLPKKMDHGDCTADSVVDIFDGDSNALMLYMCKWCNYMQVHKSRIMRHLKYEHEKIDINFNRNIERVYVIPDLTPVTHTINSPYKLLIDSKRYICSVGQCSGKEFANSTEFKSHFMQQHNDETRFACPHCDIVIEKQHRNLISDILGHYGLHGHYLFECPLCEIIFAAEYDILQHFVRNHTNESIKYFNNWAQMHGVGEKREYTIFLQCNVCNAHLENSNKAIEHFLTVHKSYYMDCEAIKMVKRTTIDSTTSAIAKDKKIFTLRRSLNCKLCDQLSKTKGMLIEHFNRDHPGHQIVAKMGKIYVENVTWDKNYKDFSIQHLRFDNHLVFYCAACHDAEQSSTSRAFVNVYDVHAHWMLTHTKSTDSKPFRFYAVEFVACYYCKLISTFDEVKRHQQAAHTNEPLVITNILNRQKCALCDYCADNLAYHLKTAHELVLRMNEFNLTRFTDETLSKLLAIEVYKKYKCHYCLEVCETKDNIKQHITNDHKLPIKFDTFVDNHNVKIIAGCCESVIDLQEFLNHMADPNHVFKTYCAKCNFRTEKLDELFEFVKHQVTVHSALIDPDFLFRRLLKTKFWQTQVIFGNGLVLTKHNLLGTEFDDSKPFDELIEHLLNVARERHMAKDDKKNNTF